MNYLRLYTFFFTLEGTENILWTEIGSRAKIKNYSDKLNIKWKVRAVTQKAEINTLSNYWI